MSARPCKTKGKRADGPFAGEFGCAEDSMRPMPLYTVVLQNVQVSR